MMPCHNKVHVCSSPKRVQKCSSNQTYRNTDNVVVMLGFPIGGVFQTRLPLVAGMHATIGTAEAVVCQGFPGGGGELSRAIL